MEQLSRDLRYDVHRFRKRCGPPLSHLQTRATLEYTAWTEKLIGLTVGFRTMCNIGVFKWSVHRLRCLLMAMDGIEIDLG